VHTRNHAFDPAQLDVAAGSSVTCITEDPVPRTISDSGQLPVKSYSVEFGGTGTPRCHRAVDPEMNGSVSVGGDTAAQPPGAQEVANYSTTVEEPAGSSERATNDSAPLPGRPEEPADEPSQG
jgi:plastocyanin